MAVVESEKFSRRKAGVYYLPGGREYIGVTTMLNAIHKEALVRWKVKTAAEMILNDPQTYNTADKVLAGLYSKKTNAADRGSLVHSFAEALLKGSEIPRTSVPEAFQGYFDAFRRFADDYQPTPLFVEPNVFSDQYQYAGTTDLIAVFGRTIRMIDFKTGGVWPEVCLQLTAYRNCDYICTRPPDVKLIPMPPVAETWAVHLDLEGWYKVYRAEASMEDVLAVRRVWGWTKTGNKGLVALDRVA